MRLQDVSDPSSIQSKQKDSAVLIVAIFIAGLCSIIYELLIGSVSAYFLGDSVKQFSITIGLYMAAMGIGAFLSRLIRSEELRHFVTLEIFLGLLGGMSVPLLYACYAIAPDLYPFVMVVLILAIGTLIGFEIPLLTRLLEKHYTLKVNISNVLGIDYFGALTATLLFPFVLLPFIGTFRSSLLFGIVNLFIGFLILYHFKERLPSGPRRKQWFGVSAAFVLMVSTFALAKSLTGIWSQNLYDDRIILEMQSRFQKIVITRYKDDLRLFINGNLQFSSRDEYRYHEALVHVPAAVQGKPSRVLILGGGDGLAVRELLRYETIQAIDLVDLDPAMTKLALEHPLLLALNQNSLADERVKISNTDAMSFLHATEHSYDLIIADLPDPNNESLARLYSREFYDLVHRFLRPGGTFVTQATSPFYAPKAFWAIHDTIEASDFGYAIAYHAYIPSFGEWGFILATDRTFEATGLKLLVETRFLNDGAVAELFTFPRDIERPASPPLISTIDRPDVLHYYLESSRYWR